MRDTKEILDFIHRLKIINAHYDNQVPTYVRGRNDGTLMALLWVLELDKQIKSEDDVFAEADILPRFKSWGSG